MQKTRATEQLLTSYDPRDDPPHNVVGGQYEVIYPMVSIATKGLYCPMRILY